jgi:hypothetical protein
MNTDTKGRGDMNEESSESTNHEAPASSEPSDTSGGQRDASLPAAASAEDRETATEGPADRGPGGDKHASVGPNGPDRPALSDRTSQWADATKGSSVASRPMDGASEAQGRTNTAGRPILNEGAERQPGSWVGASNDVATADFDDHSDGAHLIPASNITAAGDDVAGDEEGKTILHPDLSTTVTWRQGSATIEVHQGTADNEPAEVTQRFDGDTITASPHDAKNQRPTQDGEKHQQPAKTAQTSEHEPHKSDHEAQRQPGGQPDRGDGPKKPDSPEPKRPDQEQVSEGPEPPTDHPVQPQQLADHLVQPQQSADHPVQPVMGAGSHREGGDAPIPFATKEEQWQVAQDSARNWLIDRLVGLAGPADPTNGLPGGGLLQQALTRLTQDLRASEPPAHPSNLRDYELRESYQAMQHTLSVAEGAGTLVVGPIAETAAELGQAARFGEGTAPRPGAIDLIPEAEGAIEGRNVVPPETQAPGAGPSRGPSPAGVTAGPELDRDARQLGGPVREPHPRELDETGTTPQLDARQGPFAQPTAPKVRGEPSGPQDLTGTARRTGMAFHELNAAEIINNLRVEYDPVAGRPVRLSYDVDANALSDAAASGRSFARDSSTEGPQGTNAAYARSGYDRGHLIQREAFKGSVENERAADLHTHVVPMTPELNRGSGSPWRAAERATGDLARQHGSVRVEVEPVYTDNPPRLRDGTPVPETISRRVYGPDGTLLRGESFDNSRP